MGKDKSILEKITDTMKDIANIAADAADHAIKADEARPKTSERSAAYIPLAADGLVSDPMMVPPIAAARAPRRKRAASRRAAKASRKTRTKKAVKNPPRRKPQPGVQGAPPKRPRGKPAGKRRRKRAREIVERPEAPHERAKQASTD
jgi:hypothetical protein